MFIRVFTAISLLISGAIAAGSENSCIQTVDLKIQELYPPVRFVGEIERKESISLRQYINCETGKLLVPVSLAESLIWLDLALPLDFKEGLVGGDYFNPYIYTTYGASVEMDLYAYFTEAWGLGATSEICSTPAVSDMMKREEFGCFTVLLDMLRYKYKYPQPVDPLFKKEKN